MDPSVDYARIIAAAVTEAAFVIGKHVGGRVWHGLRNTYQWLPKKKLEHEHKMLLEELFGLKGKVGLLPGADHPQLPNMWAPDNVDAADKVQQYITEKKLQTSFEILHAPNNSNLIVLGSPTSSAISRRAIGYWEGSRLVIPGGEAPIDCKFYITAPDHSRTAKRWTGKKEYVYHFCDLVTKHGVTALEPLKVQGERQVTDVLVIYRIPNLDTEAAFREGTDEILVCGLQGPGTKAIGLLLQDLDTLRKLRQRIGKSRYYQAIIRVTSIRQDDEARETIPEGISFFDAESLDVDPDRIVRWFSKLRGE